MIKTDRLNALDTFRGMTIAAMILVNMPGSWSYVYAPLKHAQWHGCTPTDLIFPFFLFIVGVSIFFSFEKLSGTVSRPVIQKVFKRVVVIFMIGLALNAFPFQTPVSQLRILGVLQRIALAYGMAALLCLWCPRKNLIIISGIILIGYWLLMAVFGQGDPYAVNTNMVRAIDLKLLGANHLWHGKGIAFDPEGLLSTLPAVVTVIFGYLAGQMIHTRPDLKRAVFRLCGIGTAAILAGWGWGAVFPINKCLWTSSYVLYTSGWAMICLAALLWIIDVQGFKKWNYPFTVFGTNAIFVYTVSILWIKTFLYLIRVPEPDGTTISGYEWIFSYVFMPVAGNFNGSVLFAIFHIILFWGISLVLYRKQIFVKI